MGNVGAAIRRPLRYNVRFRVTFRQIRNILPRGGGKTPPYIFCRTFVRPSGAAAPCLPLSAVRTCPLAAMAQKTVPEGSLRHGGDYGILALFRKTEPQFIKEQTGAFEIKQSG